MKHVIFMVSALALVLGLCACGPKPPTWQEQYDLGVRYLSEGDYEEAIIAFTAAIEIDPTQALAYVGRGDAFVLSGDSRKNLKAARADYEAAIELDETLAAAYLGLADVYVRQEKPEKAAEILRQGAGLAEDTEEILEKLRELEGRVEDIRFDRNERGGYEYAVITGVDSLGNARWTYTTPEYAMTELTQVEEIGLANGRYYFNEAGTVVALNPDTGEVVWKNDEFGGASICFAFGGNGDLFLAGYYGPDFFWLDADGAALRRIERIDARYYWPSEIRVRDGYVEITMQGTPEGYGEHILTVSLEESAGDSRWRQAYLDYIRNSGLDERTIFQLIYVDNDNVPELWVCCDNIASGALVCTFDGRQVNDVYISEYGNLDYIERSGVFHTSGGHSDVYWNGIFAIQDGQFVEIFHGDFGAANNADIQFDEMGLPIYQYNWDGQDVSDQEYQDRLLQAFDMSAARNVFDDPSYDYYQMLQILSE